MPSKWVQASAISPGLGDQAAVALRHLFAPATLFVLTGDASRVCAHCARMEASRRRADGLRRSKGKAGVQPKPGGLERDARSKLFAIRRQRPKPAAAVGLRIEGFRKTRPILENL